MPRCPAPPRPPRPFWPWTLLGIGVFLGLWEAAALLAGSELLLPGPGPVLRRGIALLAAPGFLEALGMSALRVLAGVGIAAPLGVGVGLVAGLDRRGAAFFAPLFSVISATPVMAVILMVFLILGPEQTPVFTALLVIFPVMAANTIAGVRSIDPGLIELFAIYPAPLGERIRSLYLPGILPYITGGLQSAVALSWKVVVAAEVIVQPLRALGTGMEMAKAQLETAELFAWTLWTIAAAGLSQGILRAIRRPRRR